MTETVPPPPVISLLTGLDTVIHTVTTLALGAIAVLCLTVAAIRYMTALDSAQRRAAALQGLVTVLVGVLLIVNEGAILGFVEGLTGSNTACTSSACGASTRTGP
ncbi:MAG TPA: hypothetical protein VNN74_05910 [Candidatus Micrarchaeia archaeon]|nr:hypothetical protein [Candidatus Micrarchaeia archaeon]